ncbi:site-specific integrase [Bradyrhizobium sp. SRS-191]|uniref:site-specific integrase n=1 Tax=Bradyrhizobium sp. SRS-191 TaxID=2962606 RepID=UPI00211E4776|nr:site-specific integrase [Bradyrhizobium sp. SRS-191]
MLLRMPSPTRRDGSKFHYIRTRVPADLIAKAIGITLRVPIGDEAVTVRVGRTATVKISLRTMDTREAKARQAKALAYLDEVWKALREGRRTLSHKQIVALAGDFRRRAIARFDEEPGPVGIWTRLLELSEAWDEATRMREVAPFVEEHLARHALSVDEHTWAALAGEMFRAGREVAEVLKLRAEGNYAPDEGAKRFPEFKLPAVQEAPSESIRGLFRDWKREAVTAGKAEKTFAEYEAVIERFVSFLEHDNAARLGPKDIVAYKTMRLATINPRTGKTLSDKTVRDGDLSALKAVFKWAVANHRIPSNPAQGITVMRSNPEQTRPKGYTDDEAIAILGAALAYECADDELEKTAAAKRWAPWLCALAGARVGEVLQLRREDVRRSGTHWTITITPEAGPVKNKKRRDVPLHPQLVELGFVAFAEASGDGYLFLTAENRSEVRGRLNGVKNRVSEFVRSIVNDERIRPNHAWRHRFVTLSRKYDISQELRRMILAQGGKGVDEAVYGEPEGLYREICKLPRYDVGLEQLPEKVRLRHFVEADHA